MKYNDFDWMLFECWDEGIVGLIFDYSINGQLICQFSDNKNYSVILGYGQVGVNIGGWCICGEYQISYYSQYY